MIKYRQFDGRARDDLHKHIAEFIEIYGIFRYVNTDVDSIKLKLFLSSLAEDVKVLYNELSPGVITTWKQLREAFVSRFFSPTTFDRLIGEIRGFTQLPNESLVEAWLCMKDLLRSCYGHGLGKGNIIQIFYHGLEDATQKKQTMLMEDTVDEDIKETTTIGALEIGEIVNQEMTTIIHNLVMKTV
nr:reverse transcriptase domain-containing protein [Tanacetum cinerariifolium]